MFADNGNGEDDTDGVNATDALVDNNISITNDGGLTGVTINSDGTMTIPPNSTPGTYSVEYQICLTADNSICDVATAVIQVDRTPTITAQNDDFSAFPIDVTSGGATASVFLNNGGGVDDADGSTATDLLIDNNITITNDGGLTGATINTDGTINVPPNTTAGTYTVEYQICLAVNNTICDVATATIVVSSPPTADDEATGTLEDTPVTIDILNGDNDVDGTIDPTSVAVTSFPINGTLSVDPVTGEATYTPDPGFSGNDQFQYTVLDNDGNVSNVATVTINVAPSNDPPIAADDSDNTPEDTPVTTNILK